MIDIDDIRAILFGTTQMLQEQERRCLPSSKPSCCGAATHRAAGERLRRNEGVESGTESGTESGRIIYCNHNYNLIHVDMCVYT